MTEAMTRAREAEKLAKRLDRRVNQHPDPHSIDARLMRDAAGAILALIAGDGEVSEPDVKACAILAGFNFSRSTACYADSPILLAFANLIESRVLADEYVSVSLSRDGVVTTHNPFDADFDEMVRATEAIVKALQERLSNRKFCPYSHGSALKNAAIRSTDADHIAGDGK